MANTLYDLWRTSLLTGAANSLLDQNTAADGPFVALLDTGVYSFSQAHQFYSSLSGIIGTDQRIVTPTNGSVAAGVFDGDNLLFPLVSGATIEAMAIYRKNGGANTTWKLCVYLDTATGLPVTPNGGDIAVTWNAAGIFKL